MEGCPLCGAPGRAIEPTLSLDVRGEAPPGLNELLRMGTTHAIRASSRRRKRMEGLWLQTWTQNRARIAAHGRAPYLRGPFVARYRARRTSLLDADNNAASPKLVFDGLVENCVLADDRPAVIAELRTSQERVRDPRDEGYLLDLFPIEEPPK